MTGMRNRSHFFREPGFVVATNLLAGLLSTFPSRWSLINGKAEWLYGALAVFGGLTALNVLAARRFDVAWSRQSAGLLVFYECVAAGAGLWWWTQGL
jgi:hypothetical protein